MTAIGTKFSMVPHLCYNEIKLLSVDTYAAVHQSSFIKSVKAALT